MYLIAPDLAIVLTTDFFTPIHDDPFVYGQIAAANSLSDCYAMGARPTVGLNVIGFPVDSAPLELMEQILLGGAETAQRAGIPVGGGHSLKSPEPFFGMVIHGVVHPDKLLTNTTARPGNKLVLTKPLGSGIVMSAAMFDEAEEEDVRAASEVMIALNRNAAEVMVEHGATSATDVTGFGLVGHATEMARGSGLEFRLATSSLPIMRGALGYAAQGIITKVGVDNRAFYGATADFGDAPEDLITLICDPQTSGGLIISFPADRADAAVEQMQSRGVAAVIIGEAVEGEAGRLVFE